MATHPKKIIDAHCHIGEIPPWKFYDLEREPRPRAVQRQLGRGVQRAPGGDVHLQPVGAERRDVLEQDDPLGPFALRALQALRGQRLALLARERLERARVEGAEWVVLFEDVTPLGSHRLEMHVASGRALHPSSELPLDAGRPKFTLEVVQLDPSDGAWLLDRPPLMPEQSYDTREEWEARIEQARSRFGRG